MMTVADTFLAMSFLGLGPGEIAAILIVLLLLFGAKRLPELAKGMGKSIKEFKRATSDIEDDFRSAMDSDESSQRKKSEPRHLNAPGQSAQPQPAANNAPATMGQPERPQPVEQESQNKA